MQRIAARRVPAGSDARSLAEVACDEIRKAIREGRVATGAHLTEVDLASWLGMSRTPIREAMRRLQSEGLLLNQPFRGALVMRHASGATSTVPLSSAAMQRPRMASRRVGRSAISTNL